MPSTIEKLIKFFRLESERGYDNRAVVGGLKKILPIWETEASNEKINEDIIRLVKNRIDEYADHTSQERQEIIQSLLELISQTRSNPQAPGLKPQIEHLVENPHYSNRDTFPHTPNKSEGNNQRPQRKQRETGTWISGPSNTPGVDAPLTVLQGVGPKTAQSLAVLGLKTLGDLLYYFPRRYDDYSQLISINRLKYGDELTVLGTIQSISTRAIRGRQVQITEAILGDGTGFLRLTWFNQPWLDHQLQNGKSIVVSGKVEMYLGRLGMNSPDWEPLEQEHLHTNRIVPVYPLTEHITQRWLRKTMYQVVNFWAPRIPDYLPSFIRVGASLVDLPTALFQAHFPDSQERLAAARSRLAFDEIFFLQLGVLQQKRNWESLPGQIYPSPEDWYQAQLNRLPYTLTNSQINVLTDLRKDLISGRPMNRLLQGDVGSGKTIVAFLAAAIVTSHNAQVAIMAPTSILAEQHYRNICRYMVSTEDDASAHLQIDQVKLLIGDTPEKEKNVILSGLDDGSIRLVIGTHSLIEDPISFQNLQLIVVDEQHRFGVVQRSLLRAKGNNPHLLVMTATPIPRSLALTIYGDLDLSVIDEMPVGRQPISTFILSPIERERAYTLIRSQVQDGHQAFIIYPLVEKGQNDQSKAAVDEHFRLQKEVFPKFKLGLLHGRLKPEEKESEMAKFRDGNYQILVSTSVVEVGVDVPNATVMLVEGANRFGLAQLHQFRGRVGRGEAKSTCLLIPETEDALENVRLSAMAETNDGFILAERDLNQRGPGDFLGTRQAGFNEFKMSSLTDIRLIEKARKQAQDLFLQDPDLSKPDHEALEKTFHRFWGSGRGDIS